MEHICIDDVIQIKTTFCDPESGMNLEGLEAVVRLIFEENEEQEETMYLAEWTVDTLRKLPDSYILQQIDQEDSWTTVYLPQSVVKRLDKKSNTLEIEWEKETICQRMLWNQIGRTGKTIQQVFAQPLKKDQQFPYDVWETYLEENIRFPFTVEVSYPYEEDEGSLAECDRVQIIGFSGWNPALGIYARTKKEDDEFILPLRDLSVLSNTVNKNNRILDAYLTWIFLRA